MASHPFTIYGLINDDREVFYIGLTENLDKRLIDQRRLFAGVKSLTAVVLATAPSEWDARYCEKTLITAISAAGDTLVNDHHHAERFDRVRRLNRQIRFWRHAGNEGHVRRLEEALNDFQQGEAAVE